jgi:hypothetical protein
MKSLLQKKLVIVLLATLALGALTVLALSLDGVRFNEGQSLGRRESTVSPQISLKDLADAFLSVPLWKQLVVWGLLCLMTVLVGLILSPELRKLFLRAVFRTAMTMIGLWIFLKYYGDRILGLQALAEAGGQKFDNGAAQPMPEFVPPQISETFSYLVSFGIALLLVALMWGLYRSWKKYLTLTSKKPLAEIAQIARTSLHDLSSGRNSSDVIINCYLRMSDVVADKRQMQRDISMTPQEFAVRLERAGLPGDAVRRLTRLFEVVRYGERKSAPKDVTEAVSCLNTILQYCGETL